MSKRSGNHYKYFEIQLLERFGVRPEWHHVWLVAKHKGNLIIPQNIAVCFVKTLAFR